MISPKTFFAIILLSLSCFACKCSYFDSKVFRTEKAWFLYEPFLSADKVFLAKVISSGESDKKGISSGKAVVIQRWKGMIPDTIDLVRNSNTDCYGDFSDTMLVMSSLNENKAADGSSWKEGILALTRCTSFPRNREYLGREEEYRRFKVILDSTFGIQIGMSLSKVIQKTGLGSYEISPLVEHGGNWIEFKINDKETFQIRFSKNAEGKSDSNSVVNLQPRLTDIVQK